MSLLNPLIRWNGHSDPGLFRRDNEDRFLCMHFDTRHVALLGKSGVLPANEGSFVFAVADGMGGAALGEFASQTAVQKVIDWLPRLYREKPAFDRLLLLERVFGIIHDALAETARHYPDDSKGTGTTLTLVWLENGQIHLGHVGDSRLYRLDLSGTLPDVQQLSEDHTHVGWLQRTGRITSGQARFHPRRHELGMALGGGAGTSIRPQLLTLPLPSGSTFVLTTDGVSDGLSSGSLADLATGSEPDVSTPAERMIAAAKELSRDNLTAVVFHRE